MKTLSCYKAQKQFEIEFQGSLSGKVKIFIHLAPPTDVPHLTPQFAPPPEDDDPEMWFLTDAELASENWSHESLLLQQATIARFSLDARFRLPSTPLLRRVTPGVVSSTMSRVYGSGLMSGPVQETRSFYLNLRDDFGNEISPDLTASGKKDFGLSILILGPSGRSVAPVVAKRDGKLCCDYAATIAGDYNIVVSAQSAAIVGGRCEFGLSPLDSFDPSSSFVAAEPPQTATSSHISTATVSPVKPPPSQAREQSAPVATAGVEYRQEICPCDRFGNRISLPQRLSAGVARSDVQRNDEGEVPSIDEDSAFVQYDVKTGKSFAVVKLHRVGRYNVSVTDPSTGEHLVGSPFPVSVTASILSGRSSFFEFETDATQDSVRLGVPHAFQMHFRDLYGNPVAVNRAKLELIIRSRDSPAYSQRIAGASLQSYRDSSFDVSVRNFDSRGPLFGGVISWKFQSSGISPQTSPRSILCFLFPFLLSCGSLTCSDPRRSLNLQPSCPGRCP